MLAVISGLLLFAGPAGVGALEFDRAAIGAGQWWRLLTGNFVHLGGWHYFLNVSSLVLLVALCPEPIAKTEWILRIGVIAGGVGLGLYFGAPGIHDYVGLSGMIYGLFFLGLGQQAIRGDRISLACLIFLIGRVGQELFLGVPASEIRLIGGGVVPESHLCGVIAAAGYALVRNGVYDRYFKS